MQSSVRQVLMGSRYSQSFNFASGGPLDTRIPLARAGSGSYVASDNSFSTAGTNVARIPHYTWDGYEFRNSGILLEQDASQNLIAQASDLSAAPWSLTFCSYTPATYTLTSTGGGFARYSSTGLTTNANHAISVEVAPGSLSWVKMFFRDKAAADSSAFVDLATAAIGTTSGTATWTADIVDGYCRIRGIVNAGTGATTPFVQIQFATANNSTGASNGDTIKVRRVQVEPSKSVASSHIPTTGSTATRAAETMTITPRYSAAGVWGSLKGKETYYDAATADQVLLFDWRVDANNRITVSLDTDGAKTGQLKLTSVVAGVSYTVAADAMSPGQMQSFDVAWRVSPTEINIAINGYAQTAVAGGLPNLSGQTASLAGNGTRSRFRSGTGAITDTVLAQYAGYPTEKHLFLLIGQSNMEGRATYDSLGGHPDFVNQWNQAGALVDASVPLDSVDDSAGQMGPDITFSTRYRLEHPEAELIFIPSAKGSTGFSTSDWNPGNTLYEAAVTRALAAVAGTGGVLKGILWVQGEQDAIAGWTQNQYATALDAMIADLRSRIGNVPFVAGQISPALSTGTFLTRDQINAAIADLPNRVANTGYASSSGLTTLPDGVHYGAANVRTLGSRLFASWRSV